MRGVRSGWTRTMVKFVTTELLSVAVRLTIKTLSEPDDSSCRETQTK
jgi:hypothetical protein